MRARGWIAKRRAAKAWLAALTVSVLLAGTASRLPADGSTERVASAQAAPRTLEGRGVYYIEGRIRSPVAGVGSRPDYATNRLVLDDEYTTAVVDRERHRITLRNEHSYGLNQLVACLLLLGEGVTDSGQKVPVAVHLKIKKSLGRFATSIHPHPTVRENIAEASFEPFEVRLDDGRSTQVVLTPEQASEAVHDPALTARLANILMQVTDNLEGRSIDPTEPGATLVDLSFGFGSEKMNMKLARVRLISSGGNNAPLIRGGSVGPMLEKGDWEFRVDSLSPYVPRSEFDRDFFLFGIEDLSAIEQIAKRGLLRGETLVVGYRDGKGYIGVGDRRSEIPDPADVARSYLEFHFVGGVVARQVVELPGRLQ